MTFPRSQHLPWRDLPGLPVDDCLNSRTPGLHSIVLSVHVPHFIVSHCALTSCRTLTAVAS